MSTPFPKAGQSIEITETQAREMLVVLSMAGYDRFTAMRLCLKMRARLRDMSDTDFTKLAGGMSIKPWEG